ncbi:MAG: formylglycine-generating enzyme family protein [Candidatus Margulisbacteria bacterium]|nr:formylglycine-generating enzyme family protein [Candidatus Margulisiibacteriota bacterium]MBU1021864.1 formylglycine-generating enzyme family protein [Candidatus Margulisiibacteriota bacterium]MBU1729023.1 formylglycine-generating enzyme family protein [Candidatus Margulisiibacteriota bacterium]MBU1954424.1 formylglycine-generating enzyme family protein [Candidatus Margulisiibacteriota bacterium]
MTKLGRVHLVFGQGPKLRVVQFRYGVENLRRAIAGNIRSREVFRGVIGHHSGHLESKDARKILAMRHTPIEPREIEGIVIDPTQLAAREMVVLPPGKFRMGSKRHSDQQPFRDVEISGFAMGKHNVTVAEYLEYLKAGAFTIPEDILDPERAMHPVVNVSWHEAVSYCEWLSYVIGREFRLPTEAEWEYAARGKTGEYSAGVECPQPRSVFLCDKGTVPVNDSRFRPNAFGVMGLIGNVWEWTADWYGQYKAKDVVNPAGPKSGQTKVLRGAWSPRNDDPFACEISLRNSKHPEQHWSHVGFRIVEVM